MEHNMMHSKCNKEVIVTCVLDVLQKCMFNVFAKAIIQIIYFSGHGKCHKYFKIGNFKL